MQARKVHIPPEILQLPQIERRSVPRKAINGAGTMLNPGERFATSIIYVFNKNSWRWIHNSTIYVADNQVAIRIE